MYNQKLLSFVSRTLIILLFVNILTQAMEASGEKYNKHYDQEQYHSRAVVYSFKEQQRLKKQLQSERERHIRLRAAVQDTFNTTLVFTEYHNAITPDDQPLPAQKKWWELLTHLSKETYTDYSFEMWYLDLTTDTVIHTDIVSDDNPYTFRTFPDRDNNKIIPLTVHRPHHLPKGHQKSPVAIYMHGGPSATAVPGHRHPQFTALARLGYTIISPNYRGSSIRPDFEALLQGHEHKFPLEDVQSTLNYIKSQENLDAQKIVLTGISYGTYLNSLILDKIGDQLAGVVLHTGFYGNSSPSPFDHLLTIRSDLPIFLASGAKDLGNTNIDWTLKYVRALQEISTDFTFFLLEHGGHHLISLPNSEIDRYSFTSLPRNLTEIIDHTQERYNSEEIMSYTLHLIEFFDKIAYGHVSHNHSQNQEGILFPLGIHIVNKAQLSQSLKPSLPFGPTVIYKSRVLKRAPYTSSLSQLAILLGTQYNHRDLDATILAFLRKFDSEKQSIKEEFEKVYPFQQSIFEKNMAEDPKVITLTRQILRKEIEYKGNYVCYHATDSKVGFIYDIYSTLKRLLMIQAPHQNSHHRVSRLRLLDETFLQIISAEDLIKRMQAIEGKFSDKLFNYLPGYGKVAISAQWFLFGSYKYWFNSTFFRYFLQSQTASTVSLEKIIGTFFESIGITDEQARQKMIRSYNHIYDTQVHEKDGRLLQIFISPEIIDEVSYVAERGGYPLNLKIENSSTLTHAPSEIISQSLRNPLAFEDVLRKNRGNFNHQDYKDREEFTQNKPGLAYINSVEARIFMKPEHMDNAEKIQIMNYHTCPPKATYDDMLQHQVAQDLSVWLDVNPKLNASMTQKMPPLMQLKDYVEKGFHKNTSKKAFTLYDLVSSGKWEEADVWIQEYSQDIQEKKDEEGHALLYRLLTENKFRAAQWLVNHGADVNQLNAQKEPIILNFVELQNTEAIEFLINNKAVYDGDLIKKIDFCAIIEQMRTNTALWLIDQGADIEVLNDNRDTPLIFAANLGLTTIVNALISQKVKKGGDLKTYLNHKNAYGLNALLLATDKKHPETAMALIKAGAKVAVTTNQKNTPLILAALNGLTDIVTALVDKKEGKDLKAYLNYKNEYGMNALLLATDRNHSETAIALINAGANVDTPTSAGTIVLYKALNMGQYTIAEALINKGANLRLTAGDSNSLIIQLLLENKFEAAKFLLSKTPIYFLNISQSLQDKIEQDNENAAKHKALSLTQNRVSANMHLWNILFSNRPNWRCQAEVILKKNPSRNVIKKKSDGTYECLLFSLLNHSRLEQAQWLINNGADLNFLQAIDKTRLVDKLEFPPLCDVLTAFETPMNIEYSNFLIQNGANVNAFYKNGGVKKPILQRILTLANNEKEIDYLIQKGADVNSLIQNENFPLLLERLLDWNDKYRTRYGDILIRHGANVNAFYEKNNIKRPILYELLSKGQKKAATYLIEKGADINISVGEKGYPLLLEVLMNWGPQYIEEDGGFLIQNGADVNAKTKDDQSILTVLLENGKIEAAEFIRLHGGKE